MVSPNYPLRAAIVGSGLLARHLYALAPDQGVEIVVGATSTADRLGADVGMVLGDSPCDVAYARLDVALARPDVDVVLHAGPSGAGLWTTFERCAAAGVDAITSAGMFDTGRDAESSEQVRALDATARKHGARLLGTGIFPGFTADTLPLLLTSTVPDPVTVEIRQTSDISTWSANVLTHEIGIGRPTTERADHLLDYVEASARVIADGLGLRAVRWRRTNEAVPAGTATRVGSVQVDVGQTVGFNYRVQGLLETQERVTLDWQSATPGDVLGTTIAVRGPHDIRLEVQLSPFSAYAATAARILKSIRPLRTLPGGLQRGFNLPICAP